MKKFLLFCSGPITGLSFEGSTDWRKYVAKNLPPHITAVSPMRGKEYLAGVSQIEASYELHPLSSQKGITCRDRMDVMILTLGYFHLLFIIFMYSSCRFSSTLFK